jgi:hypothetical protein
MKTKDQWSANFFFQRISCLGRNFHANFLMAKIIEEEDVKSQLSNKLTEHDLTITGRDGRALLAGV